MYSLNARDHFNCSLLLFSCMTSTTKQMRPNGKAESMLQRTRLTCLLTNLLRRQNICSEYYALKQSKRERRTKNVSVQLFSCSPTHFHPTKCIRMASKFRNFKQKVSGTRYFDVQLADALARRRPTRQNILSRQAIHLRLRRLVRQMGRF